LKQSFTDSLKEPEFTIECVRGDVDAWRIINVRCQDDAGE
jgi:hypothetical protein